MGVDLGVVGPRVCRGSGKEDIRNESKDVGKGEQAETCKFFKS